MEHFSFARRAAGLLMVLCACGAGFAVSASSQSLSLTVRVGGSPAEGAAFALVNTTTGAATTLSVTSAGLVQTTPGAGTYRLKSVAPYVKDGREYRWNQPVVIDSTATTVTLTEADAVVTGGDKPRGVTFGLSVAARLKLGPAEDRVRSAAIEYPDTVIRLDKEDRTDLILSGVATAFPFQGSASWLGFTVNINLADLGSGSLSLNNKSVEGGLGIAIRASEDFAIGLTWERVFARRPRAHIQDGDPLIGETGRRIAALDSNDSRFFVDDNQHGLALHFIFRFK